MRALNLIPARRRMAQRLTRRKRSWAIAVGAYAALAIGGSLLLLPRRADNEQDTMRELAKLKSQSEQIDTKLKSQNDLANIAQRELTAANAVGEQPDWSRLLARLAELREGRVVLESVELATTQVPVEKVKPDAKPKPGAKPPAMRDAFVLKLVGATRSPDEAYVFARNLESTGLFSQARVLETKPRELLGEQVSGFRLECAFAEPPKPAPKAAKAGKPTAPKPTSTASAEGEH